MNVVTTQPKGVGAQLSEARLQRRFDEADRLFREVQGRAPKEEHLRGHARLLAELGRAQEAEPLWRELLRAKPGDFEAFHHVAAWKIVNGTNPQDAVREIAQECSVMFRTRTLRVLTAPVAKPDPDARTIVICGASFCGSTLLDRVLGSLPGVASIGESHWLTKSRDKEGVSAPIDFGVECPPFIPCSVCRGPCDVLNLDFRMDLAANRTRWYQKIARRVGSKVLFAADKNWPKLIENDPLLRVDGLILFKSPAQAWISQRSKLPDDGDAVYYEKLEQYTQSWCRSYEPFLNSFSPAGETIFLCFDDFAAKPHRLLPPLCAALGLPYDGEVLQRAHRRHTIGGNKRTMSGLRADDYAVSIKPLPEPVLPPQEHRVLIQNKQMQDLFSTMRRHHVKVFGE